MQTTHREARNLVGGSWAVADGRETGPVYGPATGEVIAQRPISTAHPGAGAYPGTRSG